MERRLPGWLGQTALILRKDVAIELASGEVVITSGFFAALIVVMASMAFYVGPATRSQVAAGSLWISVSFAAVLGLGRLWQREREEGALDGLVVAPLARSALFAGKALGLLLFLAIIELIVLPMVLLFFAVDLGAKGPGLALVALVATPGVAASGTLFGCMTARTRARDLVLAVVLFPLLAPCLLTAVVATRELLDGAPLGDIAGHLRLLVAFDIVFTAGGLGLFGTLVES